MLTANPVNPTYLLPRGTRVKHTIADHLTGTIEGYGTLNYHGQEMAQPVYLVRVDQVAELKTKFYSSISIITMNVGHVEKCAIDLTNEL